MVLILFIACLHQNGFFPTFEILYTKTHNFKRSKLRGVLYEIKSLQNQNKALFNFITQKLHFVNRNTKTIVFETFMFDVS